MPSFRKASGDSKKYTQDAKKKIKDMTAQMSNGYVQFVLGCEFC